MSSEHDFTHRKVVIEAEMPTGAKRKYNSGPEHRRLWLGSLPRMCSTEGAGICVVGEFSGVPTPHSVTTSKTHLLRGTCS